jgi:hypothetical protein
MMMMTATAQDISPDETWAMAVAPVNENTSPWPKLHALVSPIEHWETIAWKPNIGFSRRATPI